MDVVLTHMAKHSQFDAAHYTWVMLDSDALLKLDMRASSAMLAKHCDYTTPLMTDAIRLPFEHIAVVLPIGSSKLRDDTDETRYTAITLDCVDSKVRQITHWMHKVVGQTPIACKTTFVEGGKEYEFSINKALPDNIATHLETYAKGVDHRIVWYIAMASEGLLAGDQPSFHRPKTIGNTAKRIRKGKKPLYEWTTVQLERKTPELPAAPSGGTHASPRLHQRRGHWATSKLGKKFWRRESVVGDPTKGMIFHDYKGAETNA